MVFEGRLSTHAKLGDTRCVGSGGSEIPMNPSGMQLLSMATRKKRFRNYDLVAMMSTE